MAVCQALLSRDPYNGGVDLARFEYLYPPARQLILRWLGRAENVNVPFERFMFTWLAFNGWAECVTDSNTDRQYLDALMQSEFLQNTFEALKQHNSDFAAATESFASFWPIFKVRALRRSNVRRWHTPLREREHLVQYYLSHGIVQFQPQCWEQHRANNEPIPVDWPHTLAALYQVRCNLFHGEKDLASEMDREIVRRASDILAVFMRSLPGFTG